MIVKIIKELRRRMDGQSENLDIFNKKFKTIENKQVRPF